VWLGTHVDPDGDAIGSLLGLGRILRTSGRQVTLACADPVPSDLRFLPGCSTIVDSGPDAREHDLAVALDAGDAGRLGDLFDAGTWSTLPSLVIDHHVSNPGFGDVNLIDARAASTAEMIVGLLEELGLEPDAGAATCLLTGIVTDTIGFRTSNTTAATLAAAAKLMQAGAPLTEITQRIFSTRPLGALRLQGRALDRLRVEGPFAIASITLADLGELNVGPAEARGISSFLATAAEPRAVAVLREREDGQIDVSMRARPGADLSQAAQALGGGGHALAAGARVDGPLAAAEEQVLEALRVHAAPPPAPDSP
jgi:phosphoesterase RecJ-like protein